MVLNFKANVIFLLRFQRLLGLQVPPYPSSHLVTNSLKFLKESLCPCPCPWTPSMLSWRVQITKALLSTTSGLPSPVSTAGCNGRPPISLYSLRVPCRPGAAAQSPTKAKAAREAAGELFAQISFHLGFRGI